MMMDGKNVTTQFRCPVCQSPLCMGEKVWRCVGDNLEQRQHSFDVARQGYVNLLPVQYKKSKHPGDNEASVAARQRFLSAGNYQVLAVALQRFGQSFIVDLPNSQWLDIGCGEGYYTAQFLSLNPARLIALDISKPAILATAKRLKSLKTRRHASISDTSQINQMSPTSQCYPIVASASQVPMIDGAIDVITSIFSPILPDEFARLLTNNGKVIIAKPASNHLLEMRQGLFEQVIAHDSEKFIEEMSTHFALTQQQTVTHQISVNSETLADLLTMTPYSYRAKPENRQALMARCEQLGKMTLTIDFVIYGFDKLVYHG